MSLLADRVGSGALTVTIDGQAVPTGLLGAVTMRHGRPSPADAAPSPASCSWQLRADALPQLPEVGQAVRVELDDQALTWAGLTGADRDAARVRFVGHLTDLTATPGRPVSAPPLLTCTATSPRARLGRVPMVGSWPQESDSDRAQRILAAAALVAGITHGPHDPGTVTVLPRTVDGAAALQLLDELAGQSGAVLAERRDGSLTWHSPTHRRNSVVDVELTARQVLTGTASVQQLGGILNRATVAWGIVQGLAVTVTDPSSEAAYGPFGASITTELAVEADARQLAQLAVGRRSRPRWDMPAVRLELLRHDGPAGVSPQLAGRLLLLEFADLLRVVGLPATGPFTAARLWVEGWTETVSPDGWQLTLTVGDYGRNGAPPRWVDVAPSITWADVPADLTWLGAAGWDTGTDAAAGRWVDEPADRSWASTDPARTWANA